ncbi:MAG: hypothetical protein ABGY43_04205 [bacterium]|jgi:hypothetical protein|nr:hypothetical protein [Pseudomonadales bacterium]
MNFARICLVSFLTLAFSTSFGAEPDSKQIENDVMGVLDEFMITFSASDPEGHTGTYHFPHFRLNPQGQMLTWETRDDAIQMHYLLFEKLPSTGWHRSEWAERKITSISESKVHVATKIRRVREDGSEIFLAESLYVLTKVDGRWAIKLRSSYI